MSEMEPTTKISTAVLLVTQIILLVFMEKIKFWDVANTMQLIQVKLIAVDHLLMEKKNSLIILAQITAQLLSFLLVLVRDVVTSTVAMS